MSGIKRRDFLAVVAGAAACLNVNQSTVEAKSRGEKIPRPPQVKLGKTGITLSRVGQGTGMRGGNRQSNHTRMGFEKLVGLFQHGYENGITFFDMADFYGTHVYFREFLGRLRKQREKSDPDPREKLTLLTKLWWRYDYDDRQAPPPAFQKKSAKMALQRFCHELTTNYIDIVLLHCLQKADWEKRLQPYMEALSEAKEKKQVRAVGVSCHNLGALRAAAESPWVDVILARINPQGRKMDGKVEEVVPVLKRAKENGKALLGMKIYGEGSLAHMKDECIRYAQDSGLLDAMTIGAESCEQMDETLRLLGKYPQRV